MNRDRHEKPRSASASAVRFVPVSQSTMDLIGTLALETSTDPTTVIGEACTQLHRRVATSFQFFCASWYPECSDDIDPTARPRWEQSLRILDDSLLDPPLDENVELDDRTHQTLTWLQEYLDWSARVMVAEAVAQARRHTRPQQGRSEPL